MIYSSFGKYVEAIEYQEQSLTIARELKDALGEGYALGEMGIAYRALGSYVKAIEYQEQSLVIARKIKDSRGENAALGNLGNIYLSLGKYTKAIEYQKQSLVIARELKDRKSEGISLGNIGNAHFFLKNYREAIQFQKQHLVITREIKDKLGEGRALGSLGLAYYFMGNATKAIEFLKPTLIIMRELNDRHSEGIALGNLGNAYYLIGNHTKAIEYQLQRLEIANEIKDIDGKRNAFNNIGTALEKQNQLDLAIVFYKQSVNVSESVREENRLLSRDLQLSYTETVAYTYRALANLLIQQRRLPEAQAVLELLKLRELRDFTRDTRAIDSPGISLANIEKNALTEILKSFSTIGNFSQQLSECEKTNCPTLTQLETQRDNLNTAINKELKTQRKLLADHYATESATLTPEALNKEARRIVNAQDGTVLIYPLILKDKIQFLLAFKSNQGGVTFRPFETNITAETLTTTITQFRNQLENPGDINTLKATSQTLYNALIKPLEPELKAANIKHLVFAPDSTIRYIPLAALHDGKQYLIQRYTISTITAASQTNTTEKSPQPIAGQNQLLAMGASTFPNTKFSSLLNVPIELDSITTTKPGDPGIYPGTEVLDRAFNFDSIKTNLKTGTYKILHLATHGAFIPGNVEQSYIIPGSGPNLTSDRIDALANNAGFGNLHLVVLSACQTGVGDRASDGIEIPGISHFFLKNNVKSVLASLWNVSDASTALLMQKFYTYLAQGKTKAQALQQVQTEFLNSTLTTQDLPRAGVRLYRPGQLPPDSLAHPYFWAPFILIGNSL